MQGDVLSLRRYSNCILRKDYFLSAQLKFSVLIRLQYHLSGNYNGRDMTEATQRNLSIKVTQIMDGEGGTGEELLVWCLINLYHLK